MQTCVASAASAASSMQTCAASSMQTCAASSMQTCAASIAKITVLRRNLVYIQK